MIGRLKLELIIPKKILIVLKDIIFDLKIFFLILKKENLSRIAFDFHQEFGKKILIWKQFDY